MKFIYSPVLCLIIFSFFIGCSNESEPAPEQPLEQATDPADPASQACTDGITTAIEWGVETCAEPEVFAAEDVSQSTIDLTLEWYAIGSEAWGNFGPLEIYIVGEDLAAAQALEEAYCVRHMDLDDNWNEDWDCANANYEILTHYVSDGGAAVSDFRRDYLDYDFFMLILSAKYPGPEEEDYKPVALHEYFHVYQHAHIADECPSDNREPCGRGDKNGGKDKPWFAEGGAEFMAQSLYAKQSGVRENYLKEVMERKLGSLADYKAQEKRLEELTYNEPVNAYDIGAWFIAYLIHHEGEEAFLVDFYGELDALGFEESFEKHFGKARQVYVDEFNVFLDGSQADLLAIIP